MEKMTMKLILTLIVTLLTLVSCTRHPRWEKAVIREIYPAHFGTDTHSYAACVEHGTYIRLGGIRGNCGDTILVDTDGWED